MTWTAESSSADHRGEGRKDDSAVSALETAGFCRPLRPQAVGGGAAAYGRLRLRRFVGGEHEAVFAPAPPLDDDDDDTRTPVGELGALDGRHLLELVHGLDQTCSPSALSRRHRYGERQREVRDGHPSDPSVRR